MSSPNLISSESPVYIPPIIGNGEIVTTVGHTGYHTNEIKHNQVVVWAGRRFPGLAISSLVRLGRFVREISVDGSPSEAATWEQEAAPREGMVVSRLTHKLLRECSETLVDANSNAVIVATEIENTGESAVSVDFVVQYQFGDHEGRLHPGETVRVDPSGSGGRLRYEIGEHLGSVEVRSPGEPVVIPIERGLRLAHRMRLQPKEKQILRLLIGYSDRRKFYNVIPNPDIETLVSRHKESWREFFDVSDVDLGVPELKALHDNSLYAIGSNATLWSIPPDVLPGTWEGRIFHDEMYPFLALVSCGHFDLASRIPSYRLRTLPLAVERSGGRGARYAWEANEDGTEGGPYGPWMDEHFHVGQIAETVRRHCCYAGGEDSWNRFYPLFEAAADYFLLNLVERADGELGIRPCTDFDEMISPVPNGLFTLCAAIRSMETAAAVAERLDVDPRKRCEWSETAAELRKAVPVSPDGDRFLTCRAAKHRHIAELGPAFPFATHLGDDVTRRTLLSYMEECRSDVGWKPGSLPQYDGSRWMWSGSHLASALSAIGEGDKAFEVIKETVHTSGPAFSPAEQTRAEGRVNCPWFTTAAGAFVYAVNSLFVQAEDGVTELFPALPKSLKDFSFKGIAGADRLTFSAEMRKGKLTRLSVHSQWPVLTTISAPYELMAKIFESWNSASAVERSGDRVLARVQLEAGENVIRTPD